MPRVSVILNTYNRSGLLRRAIDSILNQTLADWELFVCDDHSSDATPATVATYLGDQRIRYIRQPERTGNVTRGRNDALDRAAGEYICFLDDDNAKAPTKLERLSDILDGRQNVGMAYCRSRRMHMDGSLHDILPMNKPDRFDLQRLRQDNYIDSNEVMIRRSVFERAGYFDERAVRFEDWEMWNRIALVARILPVSEPLSWYCTHPQQRVLEQGNDEDNANTRALFNWKVAHGYPRWRVVVVWPDEQVTQSQQDCMEAIDTDLRDQDWIDPRYVVAGGQWLREAVDDIRPAAVILFMLFRHGTETLQKLCDCGAPVAGICVEDPYALQANMDRARYVDVLVTNDASTVPLYAGVGQASAVTMPTLGICTGWDLGGGEPPEATHDVCLIGHAYPERIVMVRRLALAAPEVSFLAIGGDWQDAVLPENVTIEGPVSRRALVANYQRGRIVLVLNRTCGTPGRIEPVTPGRGFIEAVTGRPVIHDSRRNAVGSWFEPGREIEIAHDVEEMGAHIRRLLDAPAVREQMAMAAARRAAAFTYQKRWHQLVNQLTAGRRANIA